MKAERRLKARVLLAASALLLSTAVTLAVDTTRVASPNGSVSINLRVEPGGLSFGVKAREKTVLEPSPIKLTLDSVDLGQGSKLVNLNPYQIKESYAVLGGHSMATNYCNGALLALRHTTTGANYALEIRAYDDAVAFRLILPGGSEPRVPDEATTFEIPPGSTVWYHDLKGHYEGVYVRKEIDSIQQGEWAAPPVTFKVPQAGYAAITEAALTDYSGMALQANGKRGLTLRLGHTHPPSYPFLLRYGTNEAIRLSQPAAIPGTITTPWRVVLWAPDLNALVNSDALPNLNPPPDPALFPNGCQTDWVRPGRAVWKYLDGGGSDSLGTLKEFTRIASELGFEYQVVEGFWSNWSERDLKELIDYGKKHHVGIWLWKHSQSLHDPQERQRFLAQCRKLGVAGVKIDFFDHEAKEVIDLYQALLRETARQHLLVDFHGANKPTGESRTWPNELTREAIEGMEASQLRDRATHDVTLPFTRMLAGPADYTPLQFGRGRQNTTWAHQVASAAIFSGPLLTCAAQPLALLTNSCSDMIRSIPAVWDQTIVLPPSEIGELALFARRAGRTWFLAVMNGTGPRKLKIPLSFLGAGEYRVSLVRDSTDGTAAQHELNSPISAAASLTVDLQAGGGFVARFDP